MVTLYGDFLKWGYLQVIHFRDVFPHKPTIWDTHIYDSLKGSAMHRVGLVDPFRSWGWCNTLNFELHSFEGHFQGPFLHSVRCRLVSGGSIVNSFPKMIVDPKQLL